MKKILCLLGIHKKRECFAPYIINGIEGEIVTFICDRCGYKCPNGQFVVKKLSEKQQYPRFENDPNHQLKIKKYKDLKNGQFIP
jgi:hypothetical protein